MNEDAMNFVKKCEKCQQYADVHIAPHTELTYLTSTWPFLWRGMDLWGPFSTTPGQVKFLIVDVNYFRKCIEAEPFSKITARNVIRFFKKFIMIRFEMPKVVVTDNGTQFTDRNFRKLLTDVSIKHHFTSVEHPQTNE